MINFPFFRYGYPNFYHPYYNNYIKNHFINANKQASNPVESNSKQNIESSQDSMKNYDTINNTNQYKKDKKTSKYNSFGPIYFNNNILNGNFEDPIVEILGIELYLDDLILIGLLFLLYNEHIQDELLFISLIVLLLS